MAETPPLSYLKRDGRATLAYIKRSAAGPGPGLLFCPGFKSDMDGFKARHIDQWAAATGRGLIRFDYSGHGSSGGQFADGTIGQWAADTLDIIDQLADGPLVVIGSSMGGWIATLAALHRPAVVKALVLIAPALDFTERLMWNSFPDDIRREIDEKGVYLMPSAYGPEPTPITRRLIEDGRLNCVHPPRMLATTGAKGPNQAAPLARDRGPALPVRILQGMADPDVPWEEAAHTAAWFSGDVVMTLVRDGDHRMSDPANLARLTGLIAETCDLARG